MMRNRLCGTLVVVALAVLTACPARAGEGKVLIRHEVRIEMQAAGPGWTPQVRMWINGREVAPGDPAAVGEGEARFRVRPVPAGRRCDEAREAPAADRAVLGVHIAPLGDDLAREVGVRRGVAVTGVTEGSPARHAGLREGDVITAIDGRRVRSPRELAECIRRHRPGDRIRIAWSRPHARIEATVALAGHDELDAEEARRADREEREREEREQREAEEDDRRERPGGFLGILAAPLNDDIRDLAGTDEGVLINSLTDDSPAAEAGLKPGDVIVRIGDAETHSVEELLDALAEYGPGERVRVVYYRMGTRRDTEVTLGRRPGEEEEEAEREVFPPFDEFFGGEAPRLREYLKRLRPEMEEWARRFREEHRRQRERQETPWPEWPKREPDAARSDLDRVLDRLERIEERLERLEERLERAER